jgi:hypothetical protein
MTCRVIAVVDNTCETTFTVKHREIIAIADLIADYQQISKSVKTGSTSSADNC